MDIYRGLYTRLNLPRLARLLCQMDHCFLDASVKHNKPELLEDTLRRKRSSCITEPTPYAAFICRLCHKNTAYLENDGEEFLYSAAG
ncbi:MAG: hypothetical protein ACOX7P_09420 [Oscillospiraceae bacterium]|jgi:hypothetical protein